MKERTEKREQDLLEQHIRTRARQAVSEFLQDVQDKVERDVENRLKQLGRNDGEPEASAPAKPASDTVTEWNGLEAGTDDLYLRHMKEGRHALNQSLVEQAIWHFGLCVQLPVSLAKQEVARQQLLRALSMQRRQRPPSA